MSVGLNELKPGSVAVDRVGSICVITELRPERPVWPVVYVRQKASGTAYKGRPDSFVAVVGQVDLGAFLGILEASKAAKQQAFEQVPWLCPPSLKGLQVGDRVRIQHGSRVVEGVYEGYNPNRPKYPVSYIIDGKRWKGSEAVIIGKVA